MLETPQHRQQITRCAPMGGIYDAGTHLRTGVGAYAEVRTDTRLQT